MRRRVWPIGPRAVLAIPLLFLAGCDSPRSDAGSGAFAEHDAYSAVLLDVDPPDELRAAEAAYDARCAGCHGENALGTAQGPPLVHIVYEPSHHADIAFQLAVDRGVRAHHWGFGDMPPLPDVPRQEVQGITAYVRFLQRQVGIGAPVDR